MILALGEKQLTMLIASLNINTTGDQTAKLISYILPCCMLHVSVLMTCAQAQALESGTLIAVWTECAACPPQSIGGAYSQVTAHPQAVVLQLSLYCPVALHSTQQEVSVTQKQLQGFDCHSCLLSLSAAVCARRLEREVEQLHNQRDSINRQRKLTQEADGRALQQMEQQYKALVAKNMEINMACQELASEVSQLQETGNSASSSQDT